MELFMIFCLVVLASSKVTLQGLFAKKYISSLSDGIFFNGIIFFFSALIFIHSLNCSLPVIGFGFIFGLLTVLFQLCYIRAMSCGNVSLTVLIVNSSMILPILLSAMLFHETFSRIRITGILTVMLSLSLNADFRQKAKKQKQWIFLSTMAFFANGGLAISQQLFAKTIPNDESMSFVAWSYLIATMLSFLLFLFTTEKGRKYTPSKIRSALGCGLGAGVILGLFQLLNTKAIAQIDAGFLFPIYNGGSLILTTLTSVILLKDKLKRNQILSILIGIIGIILINL